MHLFKVGLRFKSDWIESFAAYRRNGKTVLTFVELALNIS